jgi:hypothetical protein
MIAAALLSAVNGGEITGITDAKLKAGIQAAAKTLTAHKGAALVVSGSNNVNEQIIVNAINNAIGANGSTINFGAGGSIAYLANNNAFTGANTFTNATGQTFRQDSAQDGIVVTGRAGGSSSYATTITPTTLTASRTLTAPDETGTIATQDFATAIAIALG